MYRFNRYLDILDTAESAKFLVQYEALARQVLRKSDMDQYWEARRVVRGAASHGDFADYPHRENAGLLTCLLEDIKLGKQPKEDYKSPDYIPYN